MMFKSKIHRVRVTEADLNYMGSITLDPELMEAADILPYEQVHVLDVDNGNRLITYAIPGRRNSGEACINGAAAHLVHPGDIVLVLTYVPCTEDEARKLRPRVVHVDENNRISWIGPRVEEFALAHTRADPFSQEVQPWLD
jgi:aspartate 1-decarboxylase